MRSSLAFLPAILLLQSAFGFEADYGFFDGQCNKTCADDRLTCHAGGCVNTCEEYAWCSSDYPANWFQHGNHTCECPPDRTGIDCSIVKPPVPGVADGNFCPEGLEWDGVPFPSATHSKYVQCYVDPSVEALSLRLHRVDMTIFKAANGTQELLWELKSRHRNKSITHGPDYHLCGPMTTDMSCNLTQCVINVDDPATCGNVRYTCHHVHCSTQTGGFITLFVESLNLPKSWPITLVFDSVDFANGNSTQTLHTPSLPITQHCKTGTCSKNKSLCAAPPYIPPGRSTVSYYVMASFGGMVLVLAMFAFACIACARRPTKRNKPAPMAVDPDDVEFNSLTASRNVREDSFGSAVSPVAASPSMGIIFQDVTYDVDVAPTLSGWQRLKSCCRGRSHPSTKRVLHGLTGAIKPNELVALMGPSGAGKSSLLDILASHEKSGTVKGNVEYHWGSYRVNARSVDTGSTSHTGVAGVSYVYQDDRLLPTETVRDTLLFSARIRLPRHLSEYTLAARVNRVIDALELRHIADSRVGSPDAGGGISGGERKRLAIGVELLSQPRVMLLDEPTTGLDSHSVNVVMKVLRDTAAAGCACIVSIHQPTSSTFRSFDKVVLLTKGGRLAYCGPPMAAASHLVASLGLPAPRIRASTGGSTIVHFLPAVDADGNLVEETKAAEEFESEDDEDDSLMVNPAEMLLDHASTQTEEDADNLALAFRGSDVAHSLTAHIGAVQSSCSVLAPEGLNTPKQGTSTWLDAVNMFSLLCQRGYRQMVRSPALLLTQIGLTIVVAVCLGYLFYDLPYDLNGVHNRTGVLFFNIVYFSLAAMSSLGVLILDKHTFFRERARGYYSTAPYFLSKVVVDLLPLRLLPPVIYGAITYFMMGLNPGPTNFVTFLIGMCLMNAVSASACYVISAFSNTLGKANLWASMFFVFNVLFGGLLLTGRTTVVSILMHASIFNYGFRLLMVNEFQVMKGYILFNPQVVLAPGEKPQNTLITGTEWLANWGIDVLSHKHIATDNMIALASWLLGFLLVAYLLLAFFQRYVK